VLATVLQYSHESVLAKRPSATVMAAQHPRRVGFPFRAHSGREDISQPSSRGGVVVLISRV
jgi:hypothetical protein